MAININYGSNLTSVDGTDVNGLADYMAYYEETYNDPDHASSSGFSTTNSNSVTVDGTTYSATFADDQYAGQTLDANDDPVVAFIANAGEVTIDNGSSDVTLDQLGYTFMSSPAHTLYGNLDNIQFGSSYTASGGGYSMATPDLTISNVSANVGYGMNDTDSDGVYDEVDNYQNGNNAVHDIVYGLMGGSGDNTQTDALIDAFNAYGTNVTGTSGDEEFDPYNAQDTFILGGGDDLINAGFQVGSGGDVINIDGINSFADAAAAVGDITYSGGNAYLEYVEGFITHTVEITGVSSGLTTDNFVV